MGILLPNGGLVTMTSKNSIVLEFLMLFALEAV